MIRVQDDGTVRVTVPRWGSKREAREFAERERAWIEKQQRIRRKGQERQDGRDGQDGENTEERRKKIAALRERAARELPPRLMELAVRHGFAPDAITKISVRNQKWRWGSCSRAGHICLNWRLVTAPPEVRDYVLIHELMHLRRMDHSPKFWRLVAQACPDYKALRKQLRELVPLG